MLVMAVIYAVAGGLCLALSLSVAWWAGMLLWAVLGLISTVIYWQTWNDKPPFWYLPIMVLVIWPFVWGGGIIHPLR